MKWTSEKPKRDGGKAMALYDDPSNELNSKKFHTGKLCIEGCGRPAGTAWSPHWCFECNVERINRINNQFKKLTSSFTGPITNHASD
jgi:hypothetical protein